MKSAPLEMLAFGPFRFVRFSTLNASNRIVAAMLSVKANRLNKPVSTVMKFGPRNVLRPSVPNVPRAFC